MPANRGNALPRGSKLQGGRYVIEGTLGEGGFGITYRATDTRLNRPVAIKELYPGGSQRRGNTVTVPAGYSRDRWQKSVASFLREAQTIASLEHPAIVAVHDQFEENNTAYMVMRYIDGANLMQLAQQRGGKLPEAEALRYIAEVGDALSVLHANGILHRDVKPSNIIVNRQGRAVLVDFGAARGFVPDQTLTHSVMLTPGFAPPEQLLPRARRSPTTDIYALAATSYYLLTGELPDLTDDGRLDNSHLSPRLRSSLERALAYNPADRPQTVAAFLAELEGRAAVPSPPAKQASPTATTVPNRPARSLDETVVEAGQQRVPDSGETVIESSQQRGYPSLPLYPLSAATPPRRNTALPIIAGSVAALMLLVVIAALVLGSKNSGNASGLVAIVVTPSPTANMALTTTPDPNLPPDHLTAVLTETNPSDVVPAVDLTPGLLTPSSNTSLPPGGAATPLQTDTAVPPANPDIDPSKVRTYTVSSGDTFGSIAAQFGVNTGQLLAANNAVLKHPSQLQVGQTINIPAPSYSPASVQWTVQPGENLTRIIIALQATDTSLDKIAAANPCQSSGHGVCQPGYADFPGDTLTIPFH